MSLENFLKKKSEYMSCHRTRGEVRVELFLCKYKIPFDTQYPIITKENKGYIVDFLIHNKNYVIEVDGGYHNTPEQKEYDKIKDDDLTKMGYKVIRITNKQTEKLDGNFYSLLNGSETKKKKRKTKKLMSA